MPRADPHLFAKAWLPPVIYGIISDQITQGIAGLQWEYMDPRVLTAVVALGSRHGSGAVHDTLVRLTRGHLLSAHNIHAYLHSVFNHKIKISRNF